MKKLYFGLFLLGLLFTACTPYGRPTEPITYNEVVETSSISKDDLFTKVSLWFVETFQSTDYTIQFSDKESGVIAGNYTGRSITNTLGDIYELSATITIEIKDGRYRLTFASPMYRDVGSLIGGVNNRNTVKLPVVSQWMADETMKDWKGLSESLKASITAEPAEW